MTLMDGLATVGLGAVVGLSLGLTGGGGSILAVPLLVYGAHVAPKQAALVSLVAVGAVALVGAVRKLRCGEVEWAAGTALGIGGVVGAPVGIWLAGFLPGRLMLMVFAVIMLMVAASMWARARVRQGEEAEEYRAAALDVKREKGAGASCRIHPSGKLVLTSPCVAMIAGMGLVTGVTSGIFGVGGGFVIVPVLTMLARMDIRRAVATSLLAIALVSGAGIVSGLLAGRVIPAEVTALFTAGGVAGLLAGVSIGSRLPAAVVQRVFAGVIVVVAAYVVVRAVSGG